MLETPQERARQVECYDEAIQELERRIAAQDFATLAAERRAPKTVDNIRQQRERLAQKRGGAQ